MNKIIDKFYHEVQAALEKCRLLEVRLHISLIQYMPVITLNSCCRCIERHILGLMRRFPDLDLEAVKEKFPTIDVDKLAKRDDARGNWNIDYQERN